MLTQLLERPDTLLSRQLFYPLTKDLVSHIEAFAAQHADLVERLFDLACFFQETRFTSSDAERLWASRSLSFGADSVLAALCKWNLLSSIKDAYVVHPVLWLVLNHGRIRKRFEQCTVAELNRFLLEDLMASPQNKAEWVEDVLKSDYFRCCLVKHMISLWDIDRVVSDVLFRSNWILAKMVNKGNESVASLLDDYSLVIELCNQRVSKQKSYPLLERRFICLSIIILSCSSSTTSMFGHSNGSNKQCTIPFQS